MRLRNVLGAALLLWIICSAAAFMQNDAGAQVNTTGAQRYALPGSFVSYSPSQLGINAITLPASGATAFSNIIDTRGAKQATLLWTCTQSSTVVIDTFDEDLATAFQSYTPYSTAAANGMLMIGSEHAPLSNSSSSTSANVVFPQSALSFKFQNGGSTAGTCTARLFVAY